MHGKLTTDVARCLSSVSGKVKLRAGNWNVLNDKPYQIETIWLFEYHVYKTSLSSVLSVGLP